MKERITTKSGSVYILDYKNKTWTRIKGKNAAPIRTDSGEFLDVEFTPFGLILTCPPIDSSTTFRFITTTPIASRETL